MTLDVSEAEWNENALGLPDKLFALDQKYPIYDKVSIFKYKNLGYRCLTEKKQ